MTVYAIVHKEYGVFAGNRPGRAIWGAGRKPSLSELYLWSKVDDCIHNFALVLHSATAAEMLIYVFGGSPDNYEVVELIDAPVTRCEGELFLHKKYIKKHW